MHRIAQAENKHRDNAGIYAELVAIGAELDHHESDLYVKVTPETNVALERHKSGYRLSFFVSPIDNRLWCEVPFAYSPFWETKVTK